MTGPAPHTRGGADNKDTRTHPPDGSQHGVARGLQVQKTYRLKPTRGGTNA